MPRPPAAHRASRTQAGFTLVELAVALFVLMEVLLAALLLMDFNGKLTRVQLQLTDMQQSMRTGQYELARMARMAGRGSLPKDTPNKPFPQGAAVEIRNDVGRGGRSKDVAIGFSSTPTAFPGTDIVTLRGVFSAPIFQVAHLVPGTLELRDAADNPTTDPTVAVRGYVHVCNRLPLLSSLPQDVSALERARTDKVPEALVLVSPLGSQIYAVVELDPDNTDNTSALCTKPGDPAANGMKLAFRVRGGTQADSYRRLSPVATGALGLHASLRTVAYVGILEEYRYYVREDYMIAADPTSEPKPHLSQARLFPGTESPYGSTASERAANLKVDIADGIADLQATLALDTNNDGSIGAEGTPGAGAVADEWLYNDPGDVSTDVRWQTTVPAAIPAVASPLYYLRLTTLGRTQRRDNQYQAPLLTTIEDHSYVGDQANLREYRMFRRRVQQSIIDLRNL